MVSRFNKYLVGGIIAFFFIPGISAFGQTTATYSNNTCVGAPRDCGGAYDVISESSLPTCGSTKVSSSSEPLLRVRERQFGVEYSISSIVKVASGRDQCFRKSITEVGWATSATWDQEEASLFVIDRYWNDVIPIAISTNGSTEPVKNPLTAFKSVASEVRRLSGNMLLIEDDHKKEILASQDGSDFRSWMRIVDRRHGGRVLQEIYDWQPVGSGILAFCDFKVENADGMTSWIAAFAYLDLDGSDIVFDTYEVLEPVNFIYTRNLDYIATVGDTKGYYLSFDDGISITAIDARSTNERDLPVPVDFRSSIHPVLNRDRDVSTALGVYRQIEKSKMIVGIYGWQGRLYLLGKGATSGSHEETKSFLIEIDPQEGQELSRLILPTDHAHIALVPGDHYWAVIEKEHVEDFGDLRSLLMKTDSLLFLPGSWMAGGGESPLSGGSISRCPEPISREEKQSAAP